MRRIIAEDPYWTLTTVPYLSNLCLQCIVNNFEEKPIFEELTASQKDFIQERLSLSLPLHLTANLITDGVYWKRCCKQKWDVCDVSHYDHSWKRMFFERHLENIIELFIPNETDPKVVLQMVPLCKHYVKRLDISQLLPPIKEPQREEEEDGSDMATDTEYDGPGIEHFDFGILLKKLTNLEELHLTYGFKHCGMNFEWKMFEMTDRDCESLAKALKSCRTLKLFRLHQSHIEDKKCRLLVKYLLDHPSLRVLDFSHNLIGDSGARAIGKLLTKSKLEVLNMCDNNISGVGAKAIAHALSKPSSLLSLNLRLNHLTDEGGEAIAKAMLKNNTLLHLHLGGNKMTWLTAFALSEVLVQNNSLKSINLSCNKLGEDGGKALEKAMSCNTSVTECDIRLTEVNEQSVSSVNQVVWTNQSLQQKKQAK
ncbi:dynein regulatory complex subunit 5 isoform X2 [Acanthochromis polyacanthus]|uniref:T-complex-associated-testis-expressed 1 n=2 Tax=Acanthochromis polyacanthus TaxID=80966 RepID=A0A3Q1GPH5_9TELE|nr:dynein regulatory complex subunit 5 isoform X2 [Acanthochromis polyacanthus]XP_051792705.1 dynein regulatory complex subunit 5 isoform X2 [Acanthochromis polyacanthus]